MNKFIGVLCSALFLFAICSCQSKKDDQKLLLAGSHWNKIVILDKQTKQIEWEHSFDKSWECNSAVMTPEENILFSYRRGAMLITRDHKQLWNIEAPDSCQMQTAALLPDGNYLLAWTGHPAVIMEVNSKGEILSKTEYETGINKPGPQFRQIRKNNHGNYYIPIYSRSEIREITPKGELVKTIKVEGNPFSIMALDNGNYWVSNGDANCLTEMNLDTGETLRRIGRDDIQDFVVFFVGQVCRSANGGLYVTNWQGHDKKSREANSPQLYELDKDGKVVWSLNDKTNIGMLTSVQVIE